MTKYASKIAALWTLLIAGLIVWNAPQQTHHVLKLVRNEVRARVHGGAEPGRR